MPRSSPVDGFGLAYDRIGEGDAVVLLHGWPGDRMDNRDVTPLLTDCTVVAVDLRGFGESDKHAAPPAEAYSADAQARSMIGPLTSGSPCPPPCSSGIRAALAGG
jgi:pimeloyl-ACP methyl ester carboxylesterase